MLDFLSKYITVAVRAHEVERYLSSCRVPTELSPNFLRSSLDSKMKKREAVGWRALLNIKRKLRTLNERERGMW